MEALLWIFLFSVITFFLIVFLVVIFDGKDIKNSADRAAARGISTNDIVKWGQLNEHMICPHCQTKGRILTKQITQKKGISGAKATGAIMTGGVSLIATGLSRKEAATQAHCTKCKSTWNF